MAKIGLLILVGSLGLAIILAGLWFIGFLVYVGGSLIHLLLVLSLLVGGVGSVIGLVVMLVGNARTPSK